MMRTKEQGLLTTADAMQLVGEADRFYERAHGGDAMLGHRCPGCNALWEAFGEWIGAHAASEDELAELEAGAQEVGG